MQWVLLAVIVAGLLYLSRFYPKIAFSVLGVLTVAAGVIVFSTTDLAQTRRLKLPVDDVKINNPVFTLSYADSYRFSARLINTHDSVTLRETAVSITMLDCPDENTSSDEDCQIIGQGEERIIIEIPPGQARDVSKTITFDSAKPAGTIRWRTRITATRS